MPRDYFHRLNELTPNRMWVNNPTLEEAEKTVAAGGVACTTNPTYGSNMIKRDGEYARAVVAEVARTTTDDELAAHRAQQEMVGRIMPVFRPLHERNPWHGVVSVQGDPRRDTDANHIVQEGLDDYRRLGPNCIVKIPVIPAGLRAMECLLAENIPCIATEVFSIAQAIAAAEMYVRVSKSSGRAPVFYLTHITGIYDEYLAELVASKGIAISSEALAEAGCAVGRAQYRLFKARRYPGIMLGGGVREMKHFTEFVGGQMHITINWSTAEEMLAADPALTARMDATTPEPIIGELLDKLPDFRKAWEPDGLKEEEFAEFGPVQHFRNKFIAGWEHLLATIRQARRG